MDAKTEQSIVENKKFRLGLDEILQSVKNSDRKSRERSLAVTKIEEAIMWLGMDMKALNNGVSCYKEGHNPNNAIVEPIPDGVKL
ncbi:MAG TPA: hypothetical protein VNQ90_17725 [Chthoniobacteraceae bacterium]|nr:hypothetical protein [Chthoniobacteraceae bacterium]